MFVVTFMEARVAPAHILGVDLGDALVMRSAGGSVTDEVNPEIALVAVVTDRTLGNAARPFEVAVIHRTPCGSGFLAAPGFRAAFADRTRVDESDLIDPAVVDPAATVQLDVDRLRASPLLPSQVSVSSHGYDVQTGHVTKVTGG